MWVLTISINFVLRFSQRGFSAFSCTLLEENISRQEEFSGKFSYDPEFTGEGQLPICSLPVVTPVRPYLRLHSVCSDL